MKTVEVTLEATGAWEVWKVYVPDDADDEWVRQNFDTADDKSLSDSGADSYQITTIEFLGS